MTSFFPDLNIWVALSVAGHVHNAESWDWLNGVTHDSKLAFARYTQIGLLRLLSNESLMGQQALTLHKAWSVYDRWLEDPRVEFYPEPRDLESAFRDATAPFAGKAASKWVGDCYLLAFAKSTGSTLVTFDRALYNLARKERCPACLPERN
jgi:toxin-antitoxin system PIN domain toxin